MSSARWPRVALRLRARQAAASLDHMDIAETGSTAARPYRGRLAPSPTGLLHLGHARTFWIAHARARAHGGVLVLRDEDLDPQRSRPEFAAAFVEDLRWLGLDWQEGPDVGGPFAPYRQSERTDHYRAALERLRAGGFIYPCFCSRKDIAAAARAPHAGDDELIYPGTCRPGETPPSAASEPARGGPSQRQSSSADAPRAGGRAGQPTRRQFNWRFRVPDGESIRFTDAGLGDQAFVAGRDFGDFVVWRADDVPAYQLAVVVDDAAMGITEVVRGADLLVSTARQLLLYRALGRPPPDFFHCPLLTDAHGRRLAKRQDALSLRALRAAGETPEALRRRLFGQTSERVGRTREM